MVFENKQSEMILVNFTRDRWLVTSYVLNFQRVNVEWTLVVYFRKYRFYWK